MLPREIFKAGVPKTAFPAPFGAVSGNRPFSLVHFFLHVLLLRRFGPFFCSLKRVRAGILMSACALLSKTKDQSSWVLSHDLYWENKVYKRKRSIVNRLKPLIAYADTLLECFIVLSFRFLLNRIVQILLLNIFILC